ncbi:MAG: 2-dehydro-3-deoxygalactonokinase [Pseudoxanthomonas sp.]
MIAVDWGTSSLRVYRLDVAGNIIDMRRSAQGVLTAAGRFGTVLAQAIEGWDDHDIVMAGMIGSRQGWQEVPYLDCPAGLPEIAARMVRLEQDVFAGRDIWIAPGLHVHVDGVHDVMRGEETQLCGLLDDMMVGTHHVCLAGTHSKFALVENGAIGGFATAMTGEVFALLCEYGILGRLMQGREFHRDAFVRGVDDAQRSGGLLRHLFVVRTLGLFDEVAPQALHSYLSGLLVGHELNALPPVGNAIHLVASQALVEPYETGFARRGYTVRVVPDDITAKGLFALARTRGLAGH